jgi:hypothetical protein
MIRRALRFCIALLTGGILWAGVLYFISHRPNNYPSTGDSLLDFYLAHVSADGGFGGPDMKEFEQKFGSDPGFWDLKLFPSLNSLVLEEVPRLHC